MSTRTRRVEGAVGVGLHVVERGDAAAPTVVLVHGYPDDHTVWGPVAERLAASYHVVTYDVRGAGQSDAPRHVRDYRMDLLAADTVAVIDVVSPDRPVHLVGHDWGSIQSWHTITEPALADRFLSFTSMSGPSLDHVGQWFRAQPRRGLRGLAALARQAAHSTYIYWFQLPVLPAAVWRLGLARRWPVVLERVEGVPRDPTWPSPTLAGDAARGVRLYRANMLRRVGQPVPRHTDVPVQLIVPQGDHFATPALFDGIEALAPNLIRRDVAGGHWIVRSEPARVARWIGEHIDAVERGDRLVTVERAPVVVITGAGSGIGRATALAFADRGATVVAADIDGEAADRTADLCRLVGSQAVGHAVDVGDLDAMTAFAKAVEDDHGAPDVVVNNAGIGMAGGFLATSHDDRR